MKKYPDVVPGEYPLIILYIKFAVFMDNNGNNTNHTIHINRRLHLVINGEKCKMHKIDSCEEGLQLSDIETKNVGENGLNPRMKYIAIRLENGERTLVQEGW